MNSKMKKKFITTYKKLIQNLPVMIKTIWISFAFFAAFYVKTKKFFEKTVVFNIKQHESPLTFIKIH